MWEEELAVPQLHRRNRDGKSDCTLDPLSFPIFAMRIDVAHQFLPKQNSVRALQVMDHFGIAFEQGRHVIAERLELPIEPGMVVLFTGASGSGKSSLMREAAKSLEPGAESGGIISLDELVLPDCILIDAIELPLAEAMGLLSACGLGEAQLLLRTPAELSDGQRYRFRLALALSQRPAWVVTDEFTATLDRTLAKVVAYNIRRQCDRTETGFLLATTHEDVIADLDPDLHVHCRLDGEITMSGRVAGAHCAAEAPGGADSTSTQRGLPLRGGPPPPTAWEGRSTNAPHPRPLSRGERGEREVVKKKRYRSPTNCGSASRPVATGRTSRGGIIAAITSDSSG